MKTSTEKKPEGPRHVIRLGHVPYGFFEREIFGYFSQFGKVKRVRVCRNRKGHHTGAAFVEFVDAEVAKIAAQTMDNYLLAENRLRCRVMETVPKIIQAGPRFGKITMPGQNRFRHAQILFGEKTPEHETHQRNRMVEKLREKMQKLEAQGINYHFDFERKLKEFLSIHGIADEKGEEDHLDLKRAKKDIAPESDS